MASSKARSANRPPAGKNGGGPRPGNARASARNRQDGQGRRAPEPEPQVTASGPPSWLRILTLVLALCGLAASAYLTYTHYTDTAPAGCAESGAVNCLKVTTSPQSVIFGIPVAVLGLAFYVYVVAIMSPWAWKAKDRRIAQLRLASLVAGIGLVIYLIYAELFEIGAICLYCTSVHIITFLLFSITMVATAIWGLGGASGDGKAQPA